MIKIEVGRGWHALVLDAVVQVSTFPEAWSAQLRRADRLHGLLRLDIVVDHSDDLEAFREQTARVVAVQRAARVASRKTCEACSREGQLRIGTSRSRMLCEEHACLVGERHPLDGLVREITREHIELYARAEDPVVERWEVVRLWAEGIVAIEIVTGYLGIGVSDVYDIGLEPLRTGQT